MNITYRQLKLFQALAESGSVTSAAKAMHVTQPTASMQLREITHSVGVPLYEVISRKVHLTDAGMELARTARRISDEWDLFQQRIDAMKGLTRGKLRVAVVSTAKYFVPRLVGSFCKGHPGIDVSLEVLNRDGVVRRLRENMDDIYIMSMPPPDMDLMDEIFMGNPLVAVAASSDPLTKRKNLRLQDLAKQRFILREPGSGTRMAMEKHFRRKRFRPDVRLEMGSNEAIKEAVAGGLGLSVISNHALHGHAKEHGVAILDVEGFPIASSWHLVYPKAKRLSPIASAFKNHLMNNAASVVRGKMWKTLGK
ncbi:MAG: LysR family transcriptional regulator [Akkermansiaceae bacterium]|nr:LysR family transcriptional regulator [Akkermansiaceae bacterium]